MELPLNVQRKVDALGPAGHAWAEALPELITDLEREWEISVGQPMDGGSAAYVAPAATADGGAAVIKLAMPDGLEGNGAFARELWAVRLGQGRGYVDLLRFDADRRVMLQERLGAPLAESGLPIESQLEIIASLLVRGWQPAPPPDPAWTGAQQAGWLIDFIASTWEATGRPCSAEVVEQALAYARQRRDAFDSARAVAIHGDAHAVNVLASGDGYKLIDPDAMLSEPAHDLGVAARDLGEASEVRHLCEQLADLTDAPVQAIWEWAFIERVSTGLFILSLGDEEGRVFLDVAELLARC